MKTSTIEAPGAAGANAGGGPPRGRTAWLVGGAVMTTAAVVIAGAVGYGVLAAPATQHETQSQTYTRPISAIDVEMDGGDVTLNGRVGSAGSADTVRVQRDLAWAHDRPSISESWGNGTLRIVGRCFGQKRCSIGYTVDLSAGVAVTVHTEGGTAQTQGMTGDESITEAGGDIRVTDAAGPLMLHADGGSVTGSNLTGTRATITTGGGDVNLAYAVEPAAVAATTQGGGIDIMVPRSDSGYRVDAQANGGTSTIDVLDDPTSARTLELRSDGGDIRVRYP
jgi:Toastrack DUF4097